MQGIITKTTGSWYDVMLKDNMVLSCRLQGKFRIENKKIFSTPITIGDRVRCRKEKGLETGVITDILPRENYLTRKSVRKNNLYDLVAANVDQVFFIITLIQPRTSLGFIDRFLITAEASNILVKLIFNKKDLYGDKEMIEYENTRTIYTNAGYECYLISLHGNHDVKAQIPLMQNKLTLLFGHSGVGKSTFVNSLSRDLLLPVSDISKSSGKGKHTTSYAAIYTLPFGGWVIDAPGIKEFSIIDMKPERIAEYFPEMRSLLGQCQFNNCLHIDEPGCIIKDDLVKGTIPNSRYQTYVKLVKENRDNIKY